MGFIKNVIYHGYPLKDLNKPFKIFSKLNIQYIYCVYTSYIFLKTCYNSDRVFKKGGNLVSIIKNKWFMVIINIILVSLLFFVLAPDYGLLHYINQLFYFAYFYIFIGIIMWVVKGGFFDGITYGFRRFSSKISKHKDYLDDWEEKPLPSQTINKSVPGFFLFHGIVLSIGLLALLFLYYSS